MPFLSANGVDLQYTTTGDGPPLLMIAGFGSDGASWAPVAPVLSQQFRLIMPDNRACGQTRDNGGAIALHHYAEDCLALIDHLALRAVDIIGHSMGGAIAAEIAARAPGRVNRLMLVASLPKPTPHSKTIIESLTALREAGAPEDWWFRQFFSWIFSPRFFNDPRAVEAAVAMAIAYPHKQSPADMRRQCDSLKGADLSGVLPKITAKTRILACENDLIFPLREVAKAFLPIPNSQLETIDSAAHSLHWDRPAAFIHAVSRFFAAD